MKRILAVLIVVLTCAALVAFLGFLQNWTPRGIDEGRVVAWPLALLANLGLIGLFALSHSVMARPAFKRRWTRVIPPELERSVYLAVSALCLGLLCLWWQPMPTTLWIVSAEPVRLAILAVFGFGVVLLTWAILSIRPLHFFGLSQVFRGDEEVPFSVRGPYRFVRHPIQTGVIITLWATPHMTVGHALLAAVFTLYSVYATLRLEERDLLDALGDAYRAYRRDVPALIPGIRRGQ